MHGQHWGLVTVQIKVCQLWHVAIAHRAAIDLAVQAMVKSKIFAIEQEFDGNYDQLCVRVRMGVQEGGDGAYARCSRYIRI